jgi:hypothetical protein
MKFKFTVIGNNPRAALTPAGAAVKSFVLHLTAEDGVGGLTLQTQDAGLAEKFVYGSTLEIDTDTLQPPPSPAEKAPEG